MSMKPFGTHNYIKFTNHQLVPVANTYLGAHLRPTCCKMLDEQSTTLHAPCMK